MSEPPGENSTQGGDTGFSSWYTGDREISMRQKLINAKLLQYSAGMAQVAWNRFQNNFYLERGMSLATIGSLKGMGLLLKIVGEPMFSVLADVTEPKLVYAVCMIFGTLTLEILRLTNPLTFVVVLWVKILRITVAPATTLVTTASLHLIRGSSEGFGEQRAFGSLAWGTGAFITGLAIDKFGIDAIFFITYFFHSICLVVVMLVLPRGTNTAWSNTKGSVSTATANKAHQSPAHKSTVVTTPDTDDEEMSLLTKKDSGVDLAHEGEHAHLRELQSSSRTPSPPASSRLSSVDSDATSFVFCPARCASGESQHSPGGGCLAECTRYAEMYGGFMATGAVRTLLFNVLAYGVIMQVHETFLYLLVERDFHATRTFSGLLTTVSVLCCLPVFWYADFLIKRYGHYAMICTAQLTCFMRLGAVYMIPPHWPSALKLLLLTQLLHAFNFALFWAAAVDLIARLSPRGMENGCMAALNMCYYTIGAAAGSFLWGAMDARWGGLRPMYLGAMLSSAVVLLVTHVLHTTSGGALTPEMTRTHDPNKLRHVRVAKEVFERGGVDHRYGDGMEVSPAESEKRELPPEVSKP